MAGIGFELKRLFAKKGILANIRAYGYASIVTAGPMVLGFLLLIGLRLIAQWFGAEKLELEIMNSFVTYALLYSLIINGILSLVTTRYIADSIFLKEEKNILSSYYGAMLIQLVAGAIPYAVFLCFCGNEPLHCVLNFFLMSTVSAVWLQMTYLSAIKEYKSIIISFFISVIFAFASSALLMWLGLKCVSAIQLGVIVGYGVMFALFTILMHRFFPKRSGSCFRFLSYIDKYRELVAVGLFVNLGLFAHLIIMWVASPISVQVKGLLYGAPQYDVPAIFAYFSILISTVSFVTSVEVAFYPKYRHYFSLLNRGGNLGDLKQSQDEMSKMLWREMYYLSIKQVLFTIVYSVVVSALLSNMNIGFGDDMQSTFRVLCVGYAFYAIANCFMLMQLYFTSYKGAVLSTLLFFVVSSAGTLLLLTYTGGLYYGVGFAAGAAVMYAVALIKLNTYIKKLDYHILCSQPILLKERGGLLSKISRRLDERALAREAEENAGENIQ